MNFITDFGNPGVLLSLGALIAAWLAVRSGLRNAGVWVATVALVGLITGTLKTYFSACSLSPLHIHSPSGHVAASTVLYGGLTMILATHGSLARRVLLIGAGSIWVIAIGASRISSHAHSPEEVIAGLLIGGSVLAGYTLYYLRHIPPNPRPLVFLFAASIVAILLRQLPIHFEPVFIDFGHVLYAKAPWVCLTR